VTRALYLPAALRAQIEREARAASPRECCGLLEGMREGDAIRVTALHAARNLAQDADRFEIDPADHFRVLHGARDRGAQIVGCYHSHPNGRAEPSARDADGAWDDDFVWLIAAVGEGVTTAAYQRAADRWRTLEILENQA
jgi:proteasome lid subunit RPN8/RPN11